MRKAFLILIAIVVAGGTLAARPPKEAVLAEVVTGLVGAFAGFYAGWQASLALEAAFPTEADWIGQLNVGIVFGGIALGASGGVMLGGALFGVEGNLPLCLIGGCLGLGAGALVSIPLYAVAGLDLDMLLVPAAAVVGAVWGFNHGATPR